MPLLFTVGTGAVNPGLEKMIFSMKPGMVRRVVVPASYVCHYDYHRHRQLLLWLPLSECRPPRQQPHDPPQVQPRQIGLQRAILSPDAAAEHQGRLELQHMRKEPRGTNPSCLRAGRAA